MGPTLRPTYETNSGRVHVAVVNEQADFVGHRK